MPINQKIYFPSPPKILFLFLIILVAARDVIAGLLFTGILLASLLILQAAIFLIGKVVDHWFRGYMHLYTTALVPVRFFRNNRRRIKRKDNVLRKILGEHVPEKINELLVHEDEWNSYAAYIYLRCDPAELKTILGKHPFMRWPKSLPYFEFTSNPFPKLGKLPAQTNILVFERLDLNGENMTCRIFTSPNFSFAYATYGEFY